MSYNSNKKRTQDWDTRHKYISLSRSVPMNNSNNLEILPRRQIDSIEYGNFSFSFSHSPNRSLIYSHSLLSVSLLFSSHFHKSLSKSCNIFRNRRWKKFSLEIYNIDPPHFIHTQIHRVPVISYTPHFVCLPHHIAHANGWRKTHTLFSFVPIIMGQPPLCDHHQPTSTCTMACHNSAIYLEQSSGYDEQ